MTTVTVFLTTTGVSQNWTVPSGVSLLTSVECIGAGGPGQGSGEGGGGGAYAKITNLVVTPLSSVPFQIGPRTTFGTAIDTWFNSAGTVKAQAAQGVTGGAAGSSVGSTTFSGGNGGVGGGDGGGGGGAAGPNGAGANGGGGAPSIPFFVVAPGGGGGGGGGGTAGGTVSAYNAATGGIGGNNSAAIGGGSAGTGTGTRNGGPGSAGGGGGGAWGSGGPSPPYSTYNGGSGGNGTEWISSLAEIAGSGGGGGAGTCGYGGAGTPGNGGNGGLYGGGGGAYLEGVGFVTAGAQGIIVITYTGTPPVNLAAPYVRMQEDEETPDEIEEPFTSRSFAPPVHACFSTPALWRTDVEPSDLSSYVECEPMEWIYQTVLLPDNLVMANNCIIETNLAMAFLGSEPVVTCQAFDTNDVVLGTLQIASPETDTLWGEFLWGEAPWGGSQSNISEWRVAWSAPLIFKQMTFQAKGQSAGGFKIGNLYLKYQILGYRQQQSSGAT